MPFAPSWSSYQPSTPGAASSFVPANLPGSQFFNPITGQGGGIQGAQYRIPQTNFPQYTPTQVSPAIPQSASGLPTMLYNYGAAQQQPYQGTGGFDFNNPNLIAAVGRPYLSGIQTGLQNPGTASYSRAQMDIQNLPQYLQQIQQENQMAKQMAAQTAYYSEHPELAAQAGLIGGTRAAQYEAMQGAYIPGESPAQNLQNANVASTNLSNAAAAYGISPGVFGAFVNQNDLGSYLNDPQKLNSFLSGPVGQNAIKSFEGLPTTPDPQAAIDAGAPIVISPASITGGPIDPSFKLNGDMSQVYVNALGDARKKGLLGSAQSDYAWQQVVAAGGPSKASFGGGVNQAPIPGSLAPLWGGTATPIAGGNAGLSQTGSASGPGSGSGTVGNAIQAGPINQPLLGPGWGPGGQYRTGLPFQPGG